MKYSIEQFLNCVNLITKTSDRGLPVPIMVEGAHGIGKSEIIKQLADKWGKGFYDCRAAELTEGDILGYPKDDGDYLDYLPPKFVLEASRHPYVILFDEFNRGTPEVYNALMKAGDSHMIGNIKLHKDTRIFGAVNPNDRGHHIRSLDRAQRDRWWWAFLKPSHREWMSWAENRIHPKIFAYIKNFPENLDAPETEKMGSEGEANIEPSRRSWVRYSDTLMKAEEKSLEDQSFVAQIGSGFVGDDFASDFAFFMVKNKGETKYDKLILKGEILNITEMLSLDDSVEVMSAIESGILENTKDKPKIKEMIARFFYLVPKEILSKGWSYMKSDKVDLLLSIELLNTPITCNRTDVTLIPVDEEGNPSTMTLSQYAMKTLDL